MTERRQVRVTDQFFDRLDALLPQERSADRMPSAADFLLHEMPKIIEALATDYPAATLPVDDAADVRMLITHGLMVAFIVVYVIVAPDGSIEILSLDLERCDEGLRTHLPTLPMYQHVSVRGAPGCVGMSVLCRLVHPLGVRDEARSRFVASTRRVATAAHANGDHERAETVLRRIIATDNYDQPAHRALVAHLHGTGRHGEARNAHDAYVAAMTELGMSAADYDDAVTL